MRWFSKVSRIRIFRRFPLYQSLNDGFIITRKYLRHSTLTLQYKNNLIWKQNDLKTNYQSVIINTFFLNISDAPYCRLVNRNCIITIIWLLRNGKKKIIKFNLIVQAWRHCFCRICMVSCCLVNCRKSKKEITSLIDRDLREQSFLRKGSTNNSNRSVKRQWVPQS